MSNLIKFKDWPALFRAGAFGGWNPPRYKQNSELEEYCIEALHWWLREAVGIELSVRSRPDQLIRSSPQPDFECSTSADVKIWIEISGLYYPNDRMKGLALYDSFISIIAKELRALNGRWTLSLPNYRVINSEDWRRAKGLAQELASLTKKGDQATIFNPIEATLSRRPSGPSGIIVSYSTSDSFRQQETILALTEQAEQILDEARVKLGDYPLGRGCVLLLTQNNTFGASHLAQAFSEIENSRFDFCGAVWWLHIGLPHTVQGLHVRDDLFVEGQAS